MFFHIINRVRAGDDCEKPVISTSTSGARYKPGDQSDRPGWAWTHFSEIALNSTYRPCSVKCQVLLQKIRSSTEFAPKWRFTLESTWNPMISGDWCTFGLSRCRSQSSLVGTGCHVPQTSLDLYSLQLRRQIGRKEVPVSKNRGSI